MGVVLRQRRRGRALFNVVSLRNSSVLHETQRM